MVDYNQFVTNLYRSELGRDDAAISQGEIDAWVNALSSGGLSQQQVADMIERSPEGVAYDVNRIYDKELIRAPDEAGAKAWGQALQSGALSDDQFQQMVRQSPEYSTAALAQYQDLLNKTYQQEVGRNPATSEAAQWAAALRSGAIKPDQLPGLFSDTSEGWVYDQYNNLFKRSPSDDAKGWIDALEKKALTREQVLAQLMASPEYVKANPTKTGVVPLQGAAATGGSPGYVSAFTNYAPMKAMVDPRSQMFGFLHDTIEQRLGKGPIPTGGLLGITSLGRGASQSPVNWAEGAQQQTPASTGGYAGGGTSNPNLVGGILDARNLVNNTYQNIFNRQGDEAGLNSWSQAVMNGMTQQQLENAFRASPEYQSMKSSSNETPTASYDIGGGGR